MLVDFHGNVKLDKAHADVLEKTWLNSKLSVALNPLCAKFFRENENIYIHLVPLLHIDLAQVLKILPQVRPGPTYSI